MNRKYALIALLLGLSACQKPTTYGPKVSPDELAAERNTQANMAARAEIERKNTHNANRLAMENRLLKVSGPIARAGSELCMDIRPAGSECVFDFKLQPEEDAFGHKYNDGINAYADGQNIVVTPAMMRFLKNDDELAMILSHEYAHNLMGHHADKMANAVAGAIVGALVDVAAGSQGYNSRGDFTRVGAGIGAGSYSVEYEQEADYVGLYIMSRSRYDVRNALNFWRRFSVKEPQLVDMSTTHPTNPERFIALQKTLKEIEYKKQHRIALLPDFKQADNNNPF